MLERTPPELVADISNNGIVMTGGGSLVDGFDKLITARTGIHTVVAEDAISCVAKGTGKSLDSKKTQRKWGKRGFFFHPPFIIFCYRNSYSPAGMAQGVSEAAHGPAMGALPVNRRGAHLFFLKERCGMTQVLRGNIIQAPAGGGWISGSTAIWCWRTAWCRGSMTRPQALASAPITDYGDRLIMQSFVDMHLHAPQYPMLGMGMDLPLLDWLNTYTFRHRGPVRRPGLARRTYRRLASDLITNGTTRVCMFSLHTEATWILMEELERAGVTGYVGKVNMDRNALPGILQETTEESVSETLRWLDGCHFEHVRPILTPRFTPQLFQ